MGRYTPYPNQDTNTSDMSVHPKQLMTNPLHALSLGLGSGLAPKAPGTFGTIAALIIYYFLLADLSLPVYAAIVVLSTLVGFYLCGYTAKAMGVHDAPAIVWDEFAGLWIALICVPTGLHWLALAFVLFRFFDILKPWPISWLDKHMQGGFGIMIDDVVAGIFAWLCLHFIIFLL
ncbi:MAG: phosphatidylglycerophosphatase A [Pseudomonadales bacterium]|jgi:phosphatidylglycerophosphatase A